MRIQLLVLALAASQLGATDCGQAIADPGFDLWCGDSLCEWTVERGQISKVPTWNEGDPGASLDGDDVAIDQVSPVSASDGSCIQLSLIADVDDQAEVDINFDIYDDGSVDDSQRIPTSSWQLQTFTILVSGEAWTGLKFEITKHGSGHAVIAQLGASVVSADQSAGFEPIAPATIPPGATCVTNADCVSGESCTGANAFEPGTCAGCSVGSDACGSGMTCGLATPASPTVNVPVDCIASGSLELGAPCLADADCATGICSGTACSTCREGGSACACGAGWTMQFVGEPVPFVCSPGLHAQASGAPCASDADCASGTCNGTSAMECPDGRACSSAADCPFTGMQGATAFAHEACTAVGIQGGSCQ